MFFLDPGDCFKSAEIVCVRDAKVTNYLVLDRFVGKMAFVE